ncbi:MAG: accessory gene regulator B family protein [Oscillospiraceae bacterium]|nr:accessory gene regulator B family protein [Oscillospiraceae bacterium]
MINQLANRVASIFVVYGESSEENSDIYAYALEAIIAFLVNLAICIFISLMFGRLIEGLVFIVSFAVLRGIVGGYHAKTHRNCILVFTCIVLAVMSFLMISSFFEFNNTLALVISCLSILGIFIVIKVVRKSKHFSNAINQKIDKLGICVVVVVWLICVLCILLVDNYIGLTLSLAMLAVFGSMITLVIKTQMKGEQPNEETT